MLFDVSDYYTTFLPARTFNCSLTFLLSKTILFLFIKDGFLSAEYSFRVFSLGKPFANLIFPLLILPLSKGLVGHVVWRQWLLHNVCACTYFQLLLDVSFKQNQFIFVYQGPFCQRWIFFSLGKPFANLIFPLLILLLSEGLVGHLVWRQWLLHNLFACTQTISTCKFK